MNAQTLLRILLPIAILAGGGVAAKAIMARAPKVERQKTVAPPPLVELLRLEKGPAVANVQAAGVARAANEVTLIPEVGGRVTFVSDALVPGGRVKKGALLVRIDAREYQLALEQQKGALRSAELEVELEQQRGRLAEYEWKVLGSDEAAPPTVSRESQQAAAQENVQSTKSSVARAQLNLARTGLTAPFDATVVSESVDVGQVVSPGTQMAHLIGTEQLRVVVSVAVEELDLISVPGSSGEQGPEAKVVHELSQGRKIERLGRVTRLIERLDDRTRRAQLIVTVDDPLNPEKGLPLMPGAPVEVSIQGRSFEGVFKIPREAVQDGNVVWIANDLTLSRRELTIAWGDEEWVYATAGVEPGDSLVLTRLSAAIEKMPVRRAEAQPEKKP
jgi:RND family efflux transporter MFP subunit